MKKKTIRRSLSLLCSLALMFSLAIPAFAADPDSETTSETYYMENGTEITVTVGPAGPQTREGLFFSGTATSSTSPIHYNFAPRYGNRGSTAVWNDASIDSNALLNVTFRVIVNGENFTIPRTAVAGNLVSIEISTKSGANLDGSVQTTVRPSNADSVPFRFQVNQWFE